MGLDMYLERVFAPTEEEALAKLKRLDEHPLKWKTIKPEEFTPEECKKILTMICNRDATLDFWNNGDATFRTPQEVGYWRKANAIHGWMVQNVQNGIDDCDIYLVPMEKLLELKAICIEILDEEDPEEQKRIIDEKLPPTPGFFFGTYGIDPWYFENLKDTVKIISKVQYEEEPNFIFYQSSW